MEFRSDVVAVARKGDAALTQIVKDFGISEACLHRWLMLSDVDDGVRPGVTKSASFASAIVCSTRRTRSFVALRRSSLVSRSRLMYPLVQELASTKTGATYTAGGEHTRAHGHGGCQIGWRRHSPTNGAVMRSRRGLVSRWTGGPARRGRPEPSKRGAGRISVDVEASLRDVADVDSIELVDLDRHGGSASYGVAWPATTSATLRGLRAWSPLTVPSGFAAKVACFLGDPNWTWPWRRSGSLPGGRFGTWG